MVKDISSELLYLIYARHCTLNKQAINKFMSNFTANSKTVATITAIVFRSETVLQLTC
jgi:hypothetical protein